MSDLLGLLLDENTLLQRVGGLGPRSAVSKVIFWTVTVCLTAWVFGYVSGLFPYLGMMNFSRIGLGLPLPAETSLGTATVPRAYLFKGQTVFIDYDIVATPHAWVAILLEGDSRLHWHGWPYSGYDVNTTGKGRLVYRVPESGFYKVRTLGMGGYGDHALSYHITWGATWPNGLGSLAVAKGPVQVFPSTGGATGVAPLAMSMPITP